MGTSGGVEPPSALNAPWSVALSARSGQSLDRAGRPVPPPWVTAPLATRSWMNPTCWAAAGVSVLVAVVWVWGSSWPGGLGLVQFVLELMVLAAGLCWIVLVAIHLAARWENRSVRRRTGSSWPVRGTAALAMTGVLWTVTMGLVATDTPLRVRFELSRSAFDAAAAKGEAARATATARERAEAQRSGDPLAEFDSAGRLGLYPGGRIFAYPDSVSVEPYSPASSIGWFAYLPDGVPSSWSPSGTDGAPHRLSLGDGWWAMWYGPISLD